MFSLRNYRCMLSLSCNTAASRRNSGLNFVHPSRRKPEAIPKIITLSFATQVQQWVSVKGAVAEWMSCIRETIHSQSIQSAWCSLSWCNNEQAWHIRGGHVLDEKCIYIHRLCLHVLYNHSVHVALHGGCRPPPKWPPFIYIKWNFFYFTPIIEWMHIIYTFVHRITINWISHESQQHFLRDREALTCLTGKRPVIKLSHITYQNVKSCHHH